jgi:hypothetical protein
MSVTENTGLGLTSDTCVSEVIEAMRKQILAEPDPEDPTSGQALAENLARPEVRRNLAPLGEAVYRILTEHARPVTDATTDPAFWSWVAETQARVVALGAWQRGVVQAFANWTPVAASDKQLKQAIAALAPPSESAPAAPSALGGEIR